MPLATVSPAPSVVGLAGTASNGNADNATPQGFGGLVDAAADAQAAQIVQAALPAAPTARAPVQTPVRPPVAGSALSKDIVLADTAPPAAQMLPETIADDSSGATEGETKPTDSAGPALAPPVAVADAVVEAATPPVTLAVAMAAPEKTKMPAAIPLKEAGKEKDADAPPAAITSPGTATPDVAGQQPAIDTNTPLSLAVAPAATYSSAPATPPPTGNDGAIRPASAGSGGTAHAALTVAQSGSGGDAPVAPSRPDGLPTTLFSQTLNQPALHNPIPSGPNYPAAAPAITTAVVRAQAGQIGKDMGAVIARQLVEGREQVTVRLNPPEMGRVDVRLSFDHGGGLRAVMATESPAAMDLLRRDVGDLNRALADAGVRTDAQSFRFDSRHSGSGFTQSDHQRQHPHGQPSTPARPGWSDAAEGSADRAYRPLRASGGIDMIA